MRIFLSYSFNDSTFVHQVSDALRLYPGLDVDCYTRSRGEDDERWMKIVEDALGAANAFVLFAGACGIGKVQRKEADFAVNRSIPSRIAVQMPGVRAVEGGFTYTAKPIQVEDSTESDAEWCAEAIADAIHWNKCICGVPSKYLFSYEKVIFETYAKNKGHMVASKIMAGCPPTWPAVIRELTHQHINHVPTTEIGEHRRDGDHILVDARVEIRPDGTPVKADPQFGALTFPEAGPRERLEFPRTAILDVAIVVSGGIAPGIGAVISGIVERHRLYHLHQVNSKAMGAQQYDLRIWGFLDGFSGLAGGLKVPLLQVSSLGKPLPSFAPVEEQLANVRSTATRGGAPLTTGRCEELVKEGVLNERLLDKMVNVLRAHAIDILYVIGGEGSIRAAHCLWNRARGSQPADDPNPLSVVAVPKTMDNDILWVWQSFGFLSAVEKAKELVLQLHTEARSNPRLGVVQLFGSDAGFVASHTAHASGVCDLVLVPEDKFRLDVAFERHLKDLLINRLGGASPHAMVIMSETAVPLDYEDYLDTEGFVLTDLERAAVRKFASDGWRVYGTTPDALRTGSLKIVAGGLQRLINERMQASYWKTFRVFTNEPRHLIRTTAPSVSDVIKGERLGVLAVDNSMAGYTDFMISQWLTEYVLVPLSLVVLGRKRLKTTGIFWKSVIANTGQPDDLQKPAVDHNVLVG